MYGVMRERARNRPMQIAGLAISAAATVAAANLLISGFGNFVGAFAPPESTTLTTIAPEKETPPTPPEFVRPDDEVKLTTTDVVLPPLPIFRYDEQKRETIAMAQGETMRTGGVEAAVAPAKAVRIAPRLRSLEKPPYPGTERRAQNQGDTSLGLCIDARGRVTSASLVKSSGHPKLDEAALKWVKDARFSPGTADGAPQSVCGHTVVYEWRLEDAR